MANKLVSLAQWQAIRVTGEDAKKYLNSQLTCDVEALAENRASFACHCDAKGKVWSQFYLIVLKDQILLFQHQSSIEKSLSELKKFSVFSKVEIIADANSLQFFALLGANQSTSQHQVSPQGSAYRVGMCDNIELIIAESASDAQSISALDAEENTGDFEQALSAAVIPFITDLHQNTYVPQMLNAHALKGISFKKGCYLGQETVARMRYRGGCKKASFAFSANNQVITGSDIEVALGDNWRRSGEVILSTYDAQTNQTRGIAVMPIDSDISAQYRVKDDSSLQVQLSALPYSLDYEESK
ncbi:YgfZ/GcvT domain-containing protein [Catenovulum sediminis]|uniref:CAF17-like 4Fe-4S cluster assembly/insertion protein YgfZ n=1 Tax=Catenovulum sediminis TaxID=1740262 RepID=UPI00117C28A1|nr:folate-binding Fe/S cluster repair protein [Catenovulum sediminis]